VLPGLHDAHGHVLDQGWALESVNLVGARSVEEVRLRIEQHLAARPELEADRERWIEGIGWDQTLWDPPVFPSAVS
jgi:predicted amidohydrolase YtcJ